MHYASTRLNAGDSIQVLGLGGSHLKTMEIQLLNNVLDALDRMFDGHMHAIDLWALLLATPEVLRCTVHYDALFEPTADLLTVVRSKATDEIMQDRALAATGGLRHYLAALLPVRPVQ